MSQEVLTQDGNERKTENQSRLPSPRSQSQHKPPLHFTYQSSDLYSKPVYRSDNDYTYMDTPQPPDKDLTQAQFEALTDQEKVQIGSRKLKLKSKYIRNNYVMMRTPMLYSQKQRLDNGFENKEFEELQGHIKKTSDCVELMKKQGGIQLENVQKKLNYCVLQSDCLQERQDLANCLYKYQKSDFLCKPYKNDTVRCLRSFTDTYLTAMSNTAQFDRHII